jgi:hypothetical protein
MTGEHEVKFCKVSSGYDLIPIAGTSELFGGQEGTFTLRAVGSGKTPNGKSRDRGQAMKPATAAIHFLKRW